MKSNTIDDYIYIALIITCIILILFIIIYKCFFSYISIPSCWIYENLGFYCPGCGCTRAFIAILNFDIIGSIYYNPTVLYTVIVLFLYIITHTIDKIRKSNHLIMPYSNIYLYIGASLLILHCVIRNLLLVLYKIKI